MVDINPQAVTWPSPTQYAQSVINGESAGTSFVLKAGVHRMQTLSLRTGDTLTFEAGAILGGSEDISGWTWTKDGANNRWWTTLTSAGSTLNGTARSGYVLLQYNPILDGEPMAYKDAVGSVDAWTAYYDSGANRLYIGRDPAGLTTMELARQAIAIQASASNSTGVTIQGDRNQPGIIENYASAAQSENAGLKIGRFGSSAITNANWTFQDIVVRNFRGMAVGHGQDCLLRRLTIYNCGQIGIGGTHGDDSIFENSAVYRNAIGGWSAGWEAGNTKWARILRHINRGNWYDSIAPDETISDLHPHTDITGPLWYDIDNDGCEIYDNHVLDRGHIGSRGIFWEISGSVKMWSNICYELAWDAENAFWSQGIVFSTSGAIPGTTVFDDSLIHDNILFRCSGGVKHVSVDRGQWDIYGNPYYKAQYCEHYRNVIYIEPGLGFTGVHGSDGNPTQYSTWGQEINSEANLYIVDSLTTTHWREDPDVDNDNGIGQVNWSTWQSNGFDSPDGEAYVIAATDPRKYPDPYRGGCM